MGKFYLKPGSGLVEPSAASPIFNRTMDEDSKGVWHTESNLNFRIIVPTINNNTFSRIVTTAEDPVPCLDGNALQSNPLTATKAGTEAKAYPSFLTEANAPYFSSKLDSSCPEIISLKRKRQSENGLNLKKIRNTNWQACNGASVNRDLLFKELVSQQTTFEDTNSPKSSPCNENAIDINNESSTVDIDNEPFLADINNESITVDNDSEPFVADINDESITIDIDSEPFVTDNDSESIIIDNDIDLIASSDEESISPTPRFDRFSNSDGPRTLPRKVAIDDNRTRSNHGEFSSDSLLEASHRYESNRDRDELLLEASARYRLYRKRNIEFTDPNPAKINQVTVLDSPRSDETCKTSALDPTEHPTANSDIIDVVGTNEKVVQNTPVTCCRLPFNGHREDNEHYRLCNIILAGVVLRGEHARWLSDIPSHSGIMQAVNLIIGSSCKQIILSGKCSEEHCTSKIDLNLNIPDKSFHVFTKWFLQNAQQPSLKVILLLLSRARKDHRNIFMIVLIFTKMIVKLSNRRARQALSIKLNEIMVKRLGYKPWEAVRILIVFTVTPETELSEILDLLSILEVASKKSKNQPLKNRLYESISCLWHINDRFVCPADLLFEVLKECLVQMPVDLKLTKDRVVANLLKLPRKSLRKEFLIIDKFLDKYYPQNSEVSHLVKTSILCCSNVTKSLRDCQSYETSRVKGTGPVNPQWDYWDIREAQMKGFDFVMKNSQKDKPHEEIYFRRAPTDLPTENFEVDVWRHDLFKIVANRNTWCYDADFPSYDVSVEKSNNIEYLADLLISGKCGEVVKIISSCGDSKSLETCLETLEQKFKLGDSFDMAFAILKRLPGSLKDKTSVKSGYVRMLNSLIVKFYKDFDFKSALKFLKLMRFAGVNHMDHVPKQIDHKTFAVICSDINLQCRLYKEAIRNLQYGCLNFLGDPNTNPEQYNLLEKLVKNMFRRFLKERHASHAIDVFRIIFTEQKSLHSPLDIGKYFEGVIFLSFVSGLKKNACSPGTGANLYITVERICGNSEPFHSITYRSLLVELHREKSPEETIKRVLRICLKRKLYPDFSRGPISPLVLDSHLAKEEISIYLKYYFTHFIDPNDLRLLKTRPFVVKFLESPCPDRKVFPVPNDIMKTSRSVPDSLERFKSVLNEISDTLDADFSQDSVTISVQGVETLIRVFSR